MEVEKWVIKVDIVGELDREVVNGETLSSGFNEER